MKKNRIFIICILYIFLNGNLLSDWRLSSSTDEMSGEISVYATSESVFPNKQMDFPYSDCRAWLGVGSDGKSEWVYIGFSVEPNIVNTETRDGYDRFEMRIKWDDEVEVITMTQSWGSKFLHFEKDSYIIKKIEKSNSVKIEIPWYGEGNVYFNFSLEGSFKAILNMRSSH